MLVKVSIGREQTHPVTLRKDTLGGNYRRVYVIVVIYSDQRMNNQAQFSIINPFVFIYHFQTIVTMTHKPMHRCKTMFHYIHLRRLFFNSFDISYSFFPLARVRPSIQADLGYGVTPSNYGLQGPVVQKRNFVTILALNYLGFIKQLDLTEGFNAKIN
jgi:hypothetical protein